MKDPLYRKIVSIIHDYRTWIDVADSDSRSTFYILVGGDIHPVSCRIMTLVVKVRNGSFFPGKEWVIPEYMLDRAVHRLKKNLHFKNRVLTGKLSLRDVEAIMAFASENVINLELDW